MGSLKQRRHQAGSAFVLVLIAIVILTIIGIALASMTQTEMAIGSNERTSGRVFYVSDAGFNLAVARKLVLNDGTPKTYVMPDSQRAIGAEQVRDQVELTELLPVLSAPCNLCEINNDTSYSQQYKRLNLAFSVFASRVGVKPDGTSTTTIAQHTVGSMLDTQPAQLLPEKIFVNPNETLKIKM